jgi:hypothetical protein
MRLSEEFASVQGLTTARLEVLLTETILQTSRLQDLYIWTQEGFSAGVIISWLLHARSSLRILGYGLMVRSFIRPHRLHASVLDRIGNMNCLEMLELFRIQVMGVEFTVQIWPSLVSLILWEVTVSATDLLSLLLACTKLESFTLQSPPIVTFSKLGPCFLLTFFLQQLALLEVLLASFFFYQKIIPISAVMFLMGRCKDQSESVKNKVHK